MSEKTVIECYRFFLLLLLFKYDVTSVGLWDIYIARAVTKTKTCDV